MARKAIMCRFELKNQELYDKVCAAQRSYILGIFTHDQSNVLFNVVLSAAEVA